MAILTVGPGEQYATLGAAVAAAKDGDLVQVQAGTYIDNFATVTTKITIQGIGGMVNLVADEVLPDDGAPDSGRAIIVAETDLTLDHVAMSGAIDGPAHNNGAGLLFVGGNLNVNASYFHNDQDGLLTGPDFAPIGTITILNSEFAYNGIDNGATHNAYIGPARTLTILDSYFHDVTDGHEIKTWAATNIIENNVIADGPTSTASYSIDFVNGGNDVVSGNVIEKGPDAQNGGFFHIGGTVANTTLTISDNTIINDATSVLPVLIRNETAGGLVPNIIDNTIYSWDAIGYSSSAVNQSGNVFPTSEPTYATADPFVTPAEIDVVGPSSHNVATTAGSQTSLFAGFNLTVPYDGTVTVTLSGWNAAVGTVRYVGDDTAISVTAPTAATLNVTGLASAITADFAAGSFIDDTTSSPGTDSVQVAIADPAVFLDLGTGGAGALETHFNVNLSDLACFARETPILTDHGEVAVESLREGDLLVTASGGLQPLLWLGRRHVQTGAVSPVRVRAGAFGPGIPHTDLVLSPEHAVYVQGVLVPIRHLINGTTIIRMACAEITYFHVELAEHDVILAAGLPTESWLDTGNRAMFDNASGSQTRALSAEDAWSLRACAPLVEGGETLQAIRAKLVLLANADGFAATNLHVEVTQPGTLRVAMPPDVETLTIACPACRIYPDRRYLGALLKAWRVDGVARSLADPALTRGFHATEWHVTQPVRWTDGAGMFVIERSNVGRYVEIDVATLISVVSAVAAARGTNEHPLGDRRPRG